MSSQEKTAWDTTKNFLGGTVMTSIAELHALMPDSILFGSLLLYALTQNMAFGIFTIFLFESILSHKLISWIAAQTMGPSFRSGDQSANMRCKAGYKTPQYSVNRIFTHDQYPSYGIFSLTTIATYLGLATKDFSDTMKQMGPEWEGRSMVAYFFIGFMLLTYIICRATFCGETAGEIVVAIVLAVLSGVVFFFVNKTMFGQESMNFLGLPFMTTKQSKGQEIYVCSQTQ